MKDLRKAFEEAGYPVSDSWIRRKIAKGLLILPRSSSHFAKFHLYGESRKAGAKYEMTREQIDNTVKAFLPGGVGFYDYRNNQ